MRAGMMPPLTLNEEGFDLMVWEFEKSIEILQQIYRQELLEL